VQQTAQGSRLLTYTHINTHINTHTHIHSHTHKHRKVHFSVVSLALKLSAAESYEHFIAYNSVGKSNHGQKNAPRIWHALHVYT